MRRVLIVPDKFKGTLTAQAAAEAIAQGWKSARPDDVCQLLPMSDGGDGFGEIMGGLLGALLREMATLDAAHRPIKCSWWWAPQSKIAVIESARVIGLAMLPPGKFHPFQLDTFGLGAVLQDAKTAGARKCIVGIGGSATNDGGFGLACALGWKFFDDEGQTISEWWQLRRLARIEKPKRNLGLKIVVGVDVQNRLLGPKGCSRVYGPQKGLRSDDFTWAEAALGRLSSLAKKGGVDYAKVPGAGAAGGLGFGLMAFADGHLVSGFDLFASHAKLRKRVAASDLVITGEGALDAQTCMGKGVGQVARLCREAGVPCLALAGQVQSPVAARRLFTRTCSLTDITSLKQALKHPARYLAKLSAAATQNQ